jgi:hypothetical protein
MPSLPHHILDLIGVSYTRMVAALDEGLTLMVPMEEILLVVTVMSNTDAYATYDGVTTTEDANVFQSAAIMAKSE